MRKVLTIVALLCALGVAAVHAAGKKAPAAQVPDALYPCTEDCNTREGGYRWAEHYAIAKADDCKGVSVAFVNGCKDYVSEVARPRDERYGRRDDRRYGDQGQGDNRQGRDGDERDGDNDNEDDRYRDDNDERYGDGRDDRYDDDNGYEDNDNDNDDGYDDDGDHDDDDDDDGGTARNGSLHA